MSVIDYVDEMLVYDTGSTDATLDIVKTIDNPKLIVKECPSVTPEQHTHLRNEMLARTSTDWFWVVDGDEVYPYSAAKAMRDFIQQVPPETVGIINKWWRNVGDIYYHRPQASYQYFGKKDNWRISSWNRSILGLHWGGIPNIDDSLYDGEGKNVAWEYDHLRVLDAPRYFHLTHLQRSQHSGLDEEVFFRGRKRIDTYSFGMGRPLPSDTPLPEVFFIERPAVVPDPLEHLSPMRSRWNYIRRYFLMRGINAAKRRAQNMFQKLGG